MPECVPKLSQTIYWLTAQQLLANIFSCEYIQLLLGIAQAHIPDIDWGSIDRAVCSFYARLLFCAHWAMTRGGSIPDASDKVPDELNK